MQRCWKLNIFSETHFHWKTSVTFIYFHIVLINYSYLAQISLYSKLPKYLTCSSSSSSSRRTDRWVHFQQNAGLWLFVHTWNMCMHGIDDCYQLTRTFVGFSAQCLSKLFYKFINFIYIWNLVICKKFVVLYIYNFYQNLLCQLCVHYIFGGVGY